MHDPIRQAKQDMRSQICARLKLIGQGDRAAASARARALLMAQALWKSAQWVMCFAPLAEELDVWPLLEGALAAGKKIALPRFLAQQGIYRACQIQNLESDLHVGRFGIREPADHCAQLPVGPLDLILVPGVAFDQQGHRLGRGRGYYDQLLKSLPGITCGVAFDEQVVEAIPVEAHDIRLHCLLTPSRWVELPPPPQ